MPARTNSGNQSTLPRSAIQVESGGAARVKLAVRELTHADVREAVAAADALEGREAQRLNPIPTP